MLIGIEFKLWILAYHFPQGCPPCTSSSDQEPNGYCRNHLGYRLYVLGMHVQVPAICSESWRKSRHPPEEERWTTWCWRRCNPKSWEGWGRTMDSNEWSSRLVAESAASCATSRGDSAERGAGNEEPLLLQSLLQELPHYKELKFAEAKKAELEEELVRGCSLEVVAYEPADLILARCLDAQANWEASSKMWRD